MNKNNPNKFYTYVDFYQFYHMINIKAKKERECVYKKVFTTDAVKKSFLAS